MHMGGRTTRRHLPTLLLGQALGLRRGFGIAPELSWADDSLVSIQGHEAVLLPAHTHCCHLGPIHALQSGLDGLTACLNTVCVTFEPA